MKKYFLSIGLMVAAAFTLTNCTQELENPNPTPESNGYPFELVVKTPDTKTVNDRMSTVWAEGDALVLFHEYAGSEEYVLDGQFDFSAENVFKGSLAEELEEDAVYNWYALYPYSKYVNTPASTSTGYMTVASSASGSQTQKGNGSMSHIAGANYPLAGSCLEVEYYEGEPLEITMSHLTSLVEVVVTNNTEEELTVSSVALSAPENLVGTYYLDFTGDEVVYTSSGDNYVSKKANLKVEDAAALAKGKSAKYYLAVKPFTAAAGKTLKLSVNGYEKELALTKDVTFTAGKIKTITFAYDKVKVEVPALTIPWYEDFTDMTDETLASKYVVENGASTTKLYSTNDMLAGGEAPELLISKTNGSLSVTLATGGYVGELAFTFKSNHADYISVTCDGAELTKVTDSEYLLTIAQGVQNFTLTLTNTAGSNARVDDLEVAKARMTQTLTFETESFSFEKGAASMTSFQGQEVAGAQTTVVYSSNNEDVATVNATTGVVTLTGESGTAIITATAEQTEEYKEAVATYSVVVTNPNASVTEKAVTYNFGTDEEVGFSTWGSSYTSHTAEYADATVKFHNANKQSGTITNMPVTKGQPVEIIMKDNRTLKSFDLALVQWGSKAQNVTLNYSLDGGNTYTASETSSTFALSGNLPEGTNAIKFTFSSSGNQVGIKSLELTFDVAE